MSKGSFRRALADADRNLAAVKLSFARDTRIRAAFTTPRHVGWRVPALACAIALGVFIAVFVLRRDEPPLTAFQPMPPSVGWRAHGDELEVVAPSLVVDAGGFGRITAQRGARFVRVADGVRVLRGRVDFEVAHRSAVPALVHVSHGTIAVLGTRFTVDQRADGGRVVLHEGKIRFASGERTVVLAPGQSLDWPLAPPAPPAPPIAPAPLPKRAPTSAVREQQADPEPAQPAPPAFDIDKLLTELASLRARGRYADAVTMLEHALAEPLPTPTLERLSYELGAIETYQLARTDRACRHWRTHRERFPQGRYGDEIEAAIRRLGCKDTP